MCRRQTVGEGEGEGEGEEVEGTKGEEEWI
jgi:hypothetical protein